MTPGRTEAGEPVVDAMQLVGTQETAAAVTEPREGDQAGQRDSRRRSDAYLQQVRRGGDRQAKRALHAIMPCRMRYRESTRS